MEGSSNEQGGDSFANDWRTQHDPNLRERVIYAIVERLKISFHQVSENVIKNTAIKYEDEIYGMATDKDDYLRKMSREVFGFHRKYIIVSSDNGANTTPDSEGQGQSLPTSLPCTQNPTSQQWLPQNNFQTNLNVPESSGLPTQVPITVSAAQNLNIQMSEQGVHSNLLQQPQQSSNTMFHHQMDQQLPYMQHQQYQPMMLQPGQQQQPQNRILQQHLDDTKRFQAESYLHQSQYLADQQNHPYQLHRTHPANPSSTSGGDWREETYQKIKALKEKYSLVLTTLFQKYSDKLREIDSLPQHMPHEPVAKLRNRKASLEQLLVFLNVSRSSVSEIHRDKFSLYESHVLRFTEFHQNVTHHQKKTIQSSSPESLAQSVSERTRYRLQQEDTNPTKRLKRSITTMPSETDSHKQFSVNKIEPSYALLQEINEINGRLVETVVSICNEDVSSSSEVTAGTIVTCSYVPVALSDTFKALYESGHVTQIKPLRLLVPESYPNSSILVEKIFFDGASEHKYEDLSARARTRFCLSTQEYSEAVSLKEIAKVWEECARATLVEYAERHGGGTFRS